jgi:ABC-type branched-subunit amino acid transport system substrate-binding protein
VASAGSAGGPAGSSVGGGAPLASGPGYTATEILIGVATYVQFDRTAQAAGVKGLTTGDPVATTKLLFDDINKHGGVLGRKLVPLFHDAPATGDHAANAQAACADFTEDHRVAAVIYMAANGMKDLAPCLAKHHVPEFNTAGYPTTAKNEAKLAPYLYNWMPAYERVFPEWLDRLQARGYYQGWDATLGAPGAAPVKIGLIHAQQDPYGPLGKELMAALAARNHKVDDEQQFDATNVQSDEAGVQSAVLKFRNDGVTHVFSLDGATMLLFMEAAEQQHYRPRYAMTSFHGPDFLAQNIGQQMVGVMGFGWMPGVDVNAAHDPGPLGAAQSHCTKVMLDGGQSMSDRSEQFAAWIRCDMIYLMAESMNLAGSLQPPAMRQAVESLGTSFQSAASFGTGFSRGVVDIAAAGREFAWNSECSCVVYLNRQNIRF